MTMDEPTDLLAALQHGDSFFPSGAVSFSWGLETLQADGRVTSASQVAAFVADQLCHRWASFDRPALAAAHGAAVDLDEVRRIDDLVEAQTLAAELRSGSRRAGAALLAVHEKLGTAGAAPYRALVRAGEAPGHAAVVQGLVWWGAGLSLPAAEAVSAHGLCVGLLGAALRLGLIGHVEAQRSLQALRGEIAGILSAAPLPLAALRAFTPEADIAVMRHETAETRLFAT
jgi:urease accessory protein